MLFSSAFPGMFGTFVKYKFQRTYDAILAAPVDTEELVTAEALWIAIRAGTYGCAPMLVAMLFGLDPSWGMLLVPFIGFIAGFGWANFGIARRRADELDRQLQLRDQRRADAAVPASRARSSRSTACRSGRRSRRSSTRSTTSSQLVRDAVFGFEAGSDLGHLAFLIGFGLLTWRLADPLDDAASSSS